mmetsp:Transcript_6743/g.23031  ORF Transcript_6743/g.23031 Transcript_6743/m.23031 type:complete len:224 (-) Transcript_6743:440-1111(-)
MPMAAVPVAHAVLGSGRGLGLGRTLRAHGPARGLHRPRAPTATHAHNGPWAGASRGPLSLLQGLCGLPELGGLRGEREHILAALRLDGHLLAHGGEAVEVHLAHHELRALLRTRVPEHLPPGVHGQRVPKGPPLLVVRPNLGGGQHVGLAFHGARAEQQVPVGLARGHREGRGDQDHLGALARQGRVQLREAHVVARGQPQAPHWALHHHSPGRPGRGVARLH